MHLWGAAPPVGEGQTLNNLRNLALWIVIALLLVFLFNLFQGTGTHTAASAMSYTKFNQEVVARAVAGCPVPIPAPERHTLPFK